MIMINMENRETITINIQLNTDKDGNQTSAMSLMKYYYLLNGKIMSANEKMPDNGFDYTTWFYSIQPCEISERELNKIYTHLSIVVTDVCLRDYIKNQIEVTDIISDNNGVITFKHPKQVGEIEAVDSEQIIKFIAQRIKDEQRKHEQFQDMWHEIAARKIYKSFNITTRNI